MFFREMGSVQEAGSGIGDRLAGRSIPHERWRRVTEGRPNERRNW